MTMKAGAEAGKTPGALRLRTLKTRRQMWLNRSYDVQER